MWKYLFYSWQPVKIFFLPMIISENLIKPFLSAIISYLCLSVKIFSIYLCSSFGLAVFETHFLREQYWSAPMFWNAFFERAILKCIHVLKYIFWGSNSKCTHVLKRIFWGSNYFNFMIHGCWLVWLLHYVFCQNLHHKRNFSSLDMYKYESRS